MSSPGRHNGPRTVRISTGRQSWERWPVYDQAELGLRNFWYPVLWSSQLGRRAVGLTLLGEPVMLYRDGGTVYALHDRCPHRGVRLHEGTQHVAGTFTCPYHAWTYDLGTGVLCAALTDGPDSPIVGKVRVRTYPVEERLGLIWVFVGDEDADVPALEDDLPAELLGRRIVIGGRIEPGRSGNWRFAVENGFDEGHAKYLHRGALWTAFRELPVWNETRVERTSDDRWIVRKQVKVHWDADFPGLGHWTQKRWWKRSQTPATPGAASNVDPNIAALDLPAKASLRLPGLLRIAYPRFIHYEWAVPETRDTHRFVQLLVGFDPRPLARARFKLEYLAYIRWVFHGQFTGQDSWMVDRMEIPPEQLYRPDRSVIEWRRLVEEQHRQHAAPRAAAVDGNDDHPNPEPGEP